MAYQRHTMQFVEPGLREKLMERHRQIGPMSQYHDLKTIDAFDVRDRIATLKPKRCSCAASTIQASHPSTRRKFTMPLRARNT